jgi:hypothetical protein
MMSARLLAAAGTPSIASGGETSPPSQVYFDGMAPRGWKAEDVSVRAMATPRSARSSAWRASKMAAIRRKRPTPGPTIA